MFEERIPKAAIVDYGLGNLFSVKHACETAGLLTTVTSDKRELQGADAIILPGVGAFGDAMSSLERLDLVSLLRDVAASEKLLVGICLGMQLLMTESYEFGLHRGLDIIAGPVVRFDNPVGPSGKLKVPQVGWNRVFKPAAAQFQGKMNTSPQDTWLDSPLEGLRDGEHMYFVHSFYAKPEKLSVVLSLSRYGDIEFCSGLGYRNVFAFQFHPERSGPQGIRVYERLASLIRQRIGLEAILG